MVGVSRLTEWRPSFHEKRNLSAVGRLWKMNTFNLNNRFEGTPEDVRPCERDVDGPIEYIADLERKGSPTLCFGSGERLFVLSLNSVKKLGFPIPFRSIEGRCSVGRIRTLSSSLYQRLFITWFPYKKETKFVWGCLFVFSVKLIVYVYWLSDLFIRRVRPFG